MIVGKSLGLDRPIQCYIWGTPAKIIEDVEESEDPNFLILSARAGGFYCVPKSMNAAGIQVHLTESNKAALTFWIRCKQDWPDTPNIDETVVREFHTRSQRKVTERIDDAVLWFQSKLDDLASWASLLSTNHGANPDDKRLLDFHDFLAATSCVSENDGLALLEFLVGEELIEASGSVHYRLTANGWRLVAKLTDGATKSTSAFVAMWFSDEMFKMYDNAIEPAIREAGYEPILINRKHHTNKVDDEIITEIRRAKFIVADFTTAFLELRNEQGKLLSTIAPARGGVYFEAGFAMGLGKPVIWCARKDVVDANQLHFDTRQFSHIVWTDATDLRKQLTERITATQGEGPNSI
jgi:hypothetical protein